MRLRIQEFATAIARIWWLIVVFVGGLCIIAFSQLTFSTGETIAATVTSIGTTQGIAGDETFLMVKTEEGVTSKVTGKGTENIGDGVLLNVSNRILFRDTYSLDSTKQPH